MTHDVSGPPAQDATPPGQRADAKELERQQIKDLVTGNSRNVDRLRTAVEASLGLVPTVGSGVAGLFKLAWGSAFERRVTRMLEMLCERLLDVEDAADATRLDVDRIARRLTEPDVAAAGLTAVPMAGRAASEAKLRHLATCVAQIVRGENPWAADADYAQMLMHLVDELTATQIVVLQFLAHPGRWEQQNRTWLDGLPRDDEGLIRIETLVAAALPEYDAPPAVLRAIAGGIEARGLLTVTGIGDDGSGFPDGYSIRPGIVSELGLALLRFLELEP